MSKKRYEWIFQDGENEIIDNLTGRYVTISSPELLNEKDEKIADLETKLAESKIKYDQLRVKQLEKDAKKYKNADKELLNENIDLKDKVRELKQQLAEKEKQNEVQKDNIQFLYDLFVCPKGEQTLKALHQNKISFAVERLLNVRSFICDCTEIKEPDYTKVCDYIDNQIKAIKERE